MKLETGSSRNGNVKFLPLSIVGLRLVISLSGHFGGQTREDHPYPSKSYTRAISFWEMVERLPHTRMAGGVTPARCWVGGRAVVGGSELGERWLGGRPASGSPRGDIRITRPDMEAPAHRRTNHRTGHRVPTCGSASMVRVDAAHPHTRHRTDHPAPTCGSPCMMVVGGPAQNDGRGRPPPYTRTMYRVDARMFHIRGTGPQPHTVKQFALNDSPACLTRASSLMTARSPMFNVVSTCDWHAIISARPSGGVCVCNVCVGGGRGAWGL